MYTEATCTDDDACVRMCMVMMLSENDVAFDMSAAVLWLVHPQVTGWRTKENVIRHLCPITPVQLGSGFVIGVERVVTKVSGEFSLPSDSLSRPASHEELVLRSFDGDGWLLATTTVTGQKVKVVVPPDGFAVITRHTNALWASLNE